MIKPGSIVSEDWTYHSTDPVQLGTSAAALLSRGANDPEIIVDGIVLCESSGNATTCSLRKLPSGATTGVAYNIFTDLSLGSKETMFLPEAGHPKDLFYLQPGDAIQGLASNASRINAIINYRKRR